MPISATPPAGWTDLHEQVVLDSVDNKADWKTHPLFQTLNIRQYASRRQYLQRRKQGSLSPPRNRPQSSRKQKSVSPPRNRQLSVSPSSDNHVDKMTKSPKKSDKVSSMLHGMRGLSIKLGDFMYKLTVGSSKNLDHTICEIIKNLNITDSSNNILCIDALLVLFHSKNIMNIADVVATLEHDEGAAAIKVKLPNPSEQLKTNKDAITKAIKDRVNIADTQTHDPVSQAIDGLVARVAKEGNMTEHVVSLPKPSKLTQVGNFHDEDTELEYTNEHFNSPNGPNDKTLYPLSIPLKLSKKIGRNTVKELKCLVGFIIPISGSESYRTVSTPTAGGRSTVDVGALFASSPPDNSGSPIQNTVNMSTGVAVNEARSTDGISTDALNIQVAAQQILKAAETAVTRREEDVEAMELTKTAQLRAVAAQLELVQQQRERVAKDRECLNSEANGLVQNAAEFEQQKHQVIHQFEAERQRLCAEKASISAEKASIGAEKASISAEKARIGGEWQLLSQEKYTLASEISALAAEKRALADERSMAAAATTTATVEQAQYYSYEDLENIDAKVSAAALSKAEYEEFLAVPTLHDISDQAIVAAPPAESCNVMSPSEAVVEVEETETALVVLHRHRHRREKKSLEAKLPSPKKKKQAKRYASKQIATHKDARARKALLFSLD